MNENKRFGLEGSSQEASKNSLEQRRQKVNESLINNQLKYSVSADVADWLARQGFSVEKGGYSKPNDSEVIDDPKFDDNSLSYRLVFKNIAGSIISAETNLIDNISFADEAGQTIKEVVDKSIAEQRYWQDDNDNRVIVHRISPTSFAIAERVPRYEENPGQNPKKFEVLVSLVENEIATYSASETIEQIREEQVAELTNILQNYTDYDGAQEMYKNAIEESKELAEKYY